MKRVLFVNPFGIGDVLFTLSAIESLRDLSPGIQADLLCNERAVDLVRLCPSVSERYVFNRDEWRAQRRSDPARFAGRYLSLISAWRKASYDALVDVSLGREFAFLAWAAGIPLRAGFDYKGRGLWLNRKEPLYEYEGSPVSVRQRSLLSLAGFSGVRAAGVRLSLNEADLRAFEALRIARFGAEEKPLFAVAPGGGRSWGSDAAYKQWHPERFASVAREHHVRTGQDLVLVGDAQERHLLQEVAAIYGYPAIVLCGERLGLAAAGLTECRVLLCNDGGLMHLAHALGVRVVAVFGPVDERAYGPQGWGAAFEVVTQNVPCRPCYHRFYFPPCLNDKKCLSELSESKVLAALEKMA